MRDGHAEKRCHSGRGITRVILCNWGLGSNDYRRYLCFRSDWWESLGLGGLFALAMLKCLGVRTLQPYALPCGNLLTLLSYRRRGGLWVANRGGRHLGIGRF